MRQPTMGFTQLFIYVEPSSPPPHIPDLIPLRKQMLYGTRVESSIPKAARCHCTQAQLPTRWDRARHLHWHAEPWTEHEALKNQDGKCPYPAPATTRTLPDISLGHQPHVLLPLLLRAVLHQETNTQLLVWDAAGKQPAAMLVAPEQPGVTAVPRVSSRGRAGTVGCRENGGPAGATELDFPCEIPYLLEWTHSRLSQCNTKSCSHCSSSLIATLWFHGPESRTQELVVRKELILPRRQQEKKVPLRERNSFLSTDTQLSPC